LNSIRVGVKQGAIVHDNIAVHFFDRQDENIHTFEIAIDKYGRMDKRISGFFDELELQLSDLLEPP